MRQDSDSENHDYSDTSIPPQSEVDMEESSQRMRQDSNHGMQDNFDRSTAPQPEVDIEESDTIPAEPSQERMRQYSNHGNQDNAGTGTAPQPESSQERMRQDSDSENQINPGTSIPPQSDVDMEESDTIQTESSQERMRQDSNHDNHDNSDISTAPQLVVDIEESSTIPTDPSQDTPVQEWVPRMNLLNINSLAEIDTLTVRQLKEVLANNFVDYRGCCEKTELTDRVKRLWNEQQRNKAKVEVMRENAEKCKTTIDYEKDLCRICMDATVDCVLLNCGHMITCTACGKRFEECPMCRQYVVRVVHTFRS